MGPFLVLELPDAGIGLLPAGADRVRGDPGRAPGAGVEPPVPGGGGEQEQRLAEGVELELLVHPVADQVESAGVAGQVETALVGHLAAVHGVGRGNLVTIGVKPGGDEADGGVEQRVGTRHGGGLPRIALVPDPGVAVVIVAARLRPLRQAGCGGGYHPAVRAGQAGQDRAGVAGVPGGGDPRQRGDRVLPVPLGGVPQPGRAGRLLPEGAVRHLEHQLALLARAERQAHDQSASGARLPGAGAAHVARPPQVQGAEPGVPAAEVVLVEGLQSRAGETGPGVQHHVDPRRSLPRDDAAQHDGLMGVPGECERLPALDNGVTGDPAAAPDEGAGLVVAAPHETVLRRDRVCPVAADQRGEDGVGVPAGCAHPDDVPARPDQGPSLPIRDQRVFPQHVRRE